MAWLVTSAVSSISTMRVNFLDRSSVPCSHRMQVREQADCWIQVTSLGVMMITGASWIGTAKRKSFGRYSDPKGFLTNTFDLAFNSADLLVCWNQRQLLARPTKAFASSNSLTRSQITGPETFVSNNRL